MTRSEHPGRIGGNTLLLDMNAKAARVLKDGIGLPNSSLKK
jgi:hypothetical protein